MHSFALSRRHALAVLASPVFPALGQTPSNTVRINISLEPNSLNLLNTASAANAEVAHYNIFQGLTRMEENASISPALATDWEVSADQRSWRFAIRTGVQFHNGEKLNAEVVRDSFNLCRQYAGQNKGHLTLFNNIANLSAPDSHTLVLQLHHPDANLLLRLAESYAVIMHPNTVAQAHSHPIGTGPYRFYRWEHNRSLTLQRFEHYWGTPAHIPECTFHFMRDGYMQMEAFAQDKIDLFFNFVTHHVAQFRKNPRYQVLLGGSSGKGMLALNHRHPALADVRVRQAITHAIDREAFIHTVLQGHGTAIGSHFCPSDPGYIRMSGLYPYDPARARQLLQEAGVQTPLTLALSLPPTPYARAGGPQVAKNLADIGIQVTLQELSWPQWLDGPFTGQFDITLINHVEPLDYAIYANPQYYFGYDSPAFRTLLQRHNEAPTPRERQLLLNDIQRFLARDAVNAWIFNANIGTVVRRGLQGAWVNYPMFAHDVAAMRWA